MIRAGIGTGIRARLHGLGLHYSRGSWAAPRCREHPAGTYGGLLGPYSRAVGHGLTAGLSRATVGRAGPCCESPRRALPHGVGAVVGAGGLQHSLCPSGSCGTLRALGSWQQRLLGCWSSTCGGFLSPRLSDACSSAWGAPRLGLVSEAALWLRQEGEWWSKGCRGHGWIYWRRRKGEKNNNKIFASLVHASL